MQTLHKLILVVLTAGVLAGCKVDLYTNIPQKEGNEMLAILLRAGLDAEKRLAKDNKIDILIAASQQDTAIELLLSRGLPRKDVSSIGSIFKKDGLISTPVEEGARLIYALSQELTGTISQLDGAMAVSVHVVLSEEDVKPPRAASAAIFIKHQEDYDFTTYVPQIKQLVANSISGLSYERISVALFPSNGMLPVEKAVETGDAGSGFNVNGNMFLIAGVVVGLLLVVIAVLGVLLVRRNRSQQEALQTEQA